MLSQWTFLERLVLIREGFTTEFKQTRTTKGRQSNQMFRHNLCFNEVAMFPLFYIFMCAFCLSTFMGAILSAQATPYLLVWAGICSLGLRICSLSFVLFTFYNYIWDFRTFCVSERATVFRNGFLRCLYKLKHTSSDMAYLLNIWINICSTSYLDLPDDPRGLCDPT